MDKERIELLSKIIPIGGIFIILCSSIKLILFYRQFNIKITEFLSIGEYATLFIDDILYYLITFGVGIFSLILESDSTAINDNLDYTKYKKKRIISIIVFVITLILMPFLVSITDGLSHKLNIIKVGILLLLISIYVYLLWKQTVIKFSFSALIIIGVLFYTMMDGFIEAQNIKENRNALNYTITTKNQTINTNDDLHYLGKSQNFIYLYYLKKKKSIILLSSNIIEIQIVEKEKKQ